MSRPTPGGSSKKNESAIQYNKKMLEMRKKGGDILESMSVASGTLSQNSNDLKKTMGIYDNYSSNLGRSSELNQMLTKGHRRNVMLVYGSFYFLLLVCVYICSRRLGLIKIAKFLVRTVYSVVSSIFGLGGAAEVTIPLVDVPGGAIGVGGEAAEALLTQPPGEL